MQAALNVFKEIAIKPKFLKAFGVFICAWLCYYVFPESATEAGARMIFIFVVAALFWALEIIPLYATSFMVVLLEIFLLCRPGGVLNMDASGYKAFLLPFGSPIIILFLGGLSKT